MKSTLCALVALATISSASADIRIFNGTTDDIVVDVLSKAGQQRDVLIPARSFSPVIGAKNVPANTTEMVVYKDKSGNEIARDEYWSGCNYFFGYHSENSFRKDRVFYYDKSKNQNNLAYFINNTGSKLSTQYETADFQLEKSSVTGPDANAAGANKKNQAASAYIHMGEANATREVTFSSPIFSGPQKAPISAGGFYRLEAADGKLKVTKL